MIRDNLFKFCLASVCALLAAGAANFIYMKRDFIFERSWALPNGKFEEAAAPSFVNAARDFAEAGHPGQACVAKWLGKDDKYFYVAIGCATFSETLGKIQAVGDANYFAARLGYSDGKITGMEQPGSAAPVNALRRILPRAAAEKMRYGFSPQEFMQSGLSRMAEKGLGGARASPKN